MSFFKSILYELKFLIKYKGFKFQCPFCNKWYRQFYPGGNKGDCFDKHIIIGSGYRKNVFCPNCGSKDRERLVYLYLKNKIPVQTQGLKVLHVAPEPSLRDYLTNKKNIEYISGDRFEPGYSYPTGTIKMDILNIDFPSNYFDLIICNHVLEHIKDDDRAISEIYRVLKNGGKAILQVPYTNEQKNIEYEDYSNAEFNEKFYGQSDHVRIYSKTEYLAMLENNKFILQVYQMEKSWKKYCINENEVVFIVQK
jgi:SAM-dependent methyltransferase